MSRLPESGLSKIIFVLIDAPSTNSLLVKSLLKIILKLFFVPNVVGLQGQPGWLKRFLLHLLMT